MTVTALSDGTHHWVGEGAFDVRVATIAESLAHINRFTGHVKGYTVAQHCVLVSRLLPEELQLAGLLHDAHESIIGDIAQPVKQAIGPAVYDLENRYLDLVDLRFEVNTRHELVKAADLRMCVTEAAAFGLNMAHFPDIKPASTNIKRWPPGLAKNMWLTTFHALKGRY